METSSEQPAASERIFYDGECAVCHWSVRFVARRDPTGQTFRFAPLGGEAFRATVPEATRRELPDTMVVQTSDGRLLLRSEGVVHILGRLHLGWRLAGLLLSWVPRSLRDAAYASFARIRRRLASPPAATCPLTPPELRKRIDP